MTATSCNASHSRRHIAQNFVVIWMDSGIDQFGDDHRNTLTQLRSIVNDVNIFTQRDECIDFVTEVEDIKVFLIVENTIDREVVPLIHDIPQLDAIYVFCDNKVGHEQWAKEWAKVKGIHTETKSICESLQQAVQQFNRDSIALSFVTMDEQSSDQNLDRLDPSFMYTRIFKEILLQMKHEKQSIKDFTTYCRNGDYGSPNTVDRFENEYSDKSAIWWYTFPSFIYSMLNGALRMLQADSIIKMGFFICDLHYQVTQLFQQQVGNYHEQPFTVYRGQGLSSSDFEKLQKTKGGLVSFNNFLSTSKDQEVSLGFAHAALTLTDMVGILFKIIIDPSTSSTPFASITEVSCFQEEEILFSMHTVFRIGEITKIDSYSSLYQVELKLTTDDDKQLRTLTYRIAEEVHKCPT